MTKEEYENLLSSDYWKGYSYSLIKERDYTCQDCGRRFFNERNKLQVHHLVYRDVNPWSYKPEEVIVLCRECHERRHGITPIQETLSHFSDSGSYSKSYTDSADNGYTKSYHSREPSTFGTDTSTRSGSDIELGSQYNIPSLLQGFKLKYILWGVVFVIIAVLSKNVYTHSERIDEDLQEVNIGSAADNTDASYISQKKVASQNATVIEEDDFVEVEEDKVLTSQNTDESVTSESDPAYDEQSETTVKEKKEKSTLELLEERNHASVVKQAKRAGVSTEGTTMEILERINHASVVKQAKRAGVSTEGTTTEILERINHASVVKQAKRLGVSTEGSTTEILERINRKSLESYQ